MANYRKLPWQRNIRVIPASVAAKLQEVPRGVGIVPVCTKLITATELKDGAFRHLNMKLVADQPSFPATLLPSEDTGPYSAKNCNGWEVKRQDLPMIPKTIYLGERPIYGDWSNGSFPLWQDRMVYQVDEYAPTDYCIDIDMLRKTAASFVFKFKLDCVLDRSDANFDEDLLFCLRVCPETLAGIAELS